MPDIPSIAGDSLPIYRPLSIPTKDIRILNVNSALVDGLVSVTLEYVSLLDYTTPYYAISWCWGDQSQRRRVLVDGHPVDVPANAEIVLRELAVRHGYARVWLDALSINQLDIDERGHQVSIMREVYSNAEQVLVWLGSGQGFAGKGIDSINALVQHFEDNAQNRAGYRSSSWLRTGPRQARWFSYEPLPDNIDWDAIRHLYSVPFLYRVWIIQEIALAQEAICFYGTQSLTWHDIEVAAEWMIHRNYERSEYCGIFLRGVMNAAIIASIRKGLRHMDKLLMSGVHFDTTEPRDKIFGLMGVMNPAASKSIVPNYALPIPQVFTTATRSAIRFCDRLWILGTIRQATLVQTTDPLPSWVPEYAGNWQSRAKHIRNFADHGCNNMLPPVIDEKTDPNILRVKGISVTRIHAVFGPLDTDVLHDMDALSNLFHHLLDLAGERGCQISPTGALFNALGVNYYEENSETMTISEVHHDFNALLRKLQQSSEVSSPTLITTGSFGNFLEHIKITALHRYLFVTESGEIGQATAKPCQDDEICILFGSDVPFVLRKFEEGYKLIGGAHLPSIMDGGYVRDIQDRGTLEMESRWFNIH